MGLLNDARSADSMPTPGEANAVKLLVVEDHPLFGWLSPLLGRELTFPYKSRTQRLLRWFMRVFY